MTKLTENIAEIIQERVGPYVSDIKFIHQFLEDNIGHDTEKVIITLEKAYGEITVESKRTDFRILMNAIRTIEEKND
ncbi:MAG: hypothetical protein JSV49_02360 [Thermoplasmata archaeon]|nr:MAG: hypothetical protein JSV49_02360 [Thermoplasmata archaeon]